MVMKKCTFEPEIKSRPRRSLLYMPGTNKRALEKAQTLDADVLIFDLEDSVTPDSKEQAFENVLYALEHYDYRGRERVVRVNSLYSKWGIEEMKTLGRVERIDAILLPKVEEDREIIQCANIISGQGGNDYLPLWCMIETPRGVARASELAQANFRVQAFVAGLEDLAKSLRIKPITGRMPLITSLELIILAGRSNGLNVFDGVFDDISDNEGFAEECNQAAYMGFDGKTIIHPNQIEDANRLFTPSEEEITWAREVIKEFEAAQKHHQGVTLVHGKMIEHLHYENAQRILQIAEEIERRRPVE